MKSVLVTGVNGGIGQATATHLADKGWKVYGADVHERASGKVVSEYWQGDVSKERFWTDIIAPAFQGTGIYGLVNNAAILPCKAIQDTTLEEWTRVMAVNLGGAFLATKHLAPLMGKSSGSIVNVSSVHAVATSPGRAAYVASKGALLAFTRAAALELSARNIRVNAILPGATETRMLKAGLERGEAAGVSNRNELIKRTPLQRVGQPIEIAMAIEFLLDNERSSFMTGQSLVVDGGVLAQLASE